MKKFIVIMLVILSIGGMYYFSSKDGKVSGSQSQVVVNIIDKVRDKVTLKNQKLIKVQTKVYDKLRKIGTKSYIVRKIAHFIIYGLIGISLLLFIYIFSKKLILSSIMAFILSITYACYDEYRQISIPGRSGSIKDVFIDSCGALTGIVLSFGIILIVKFIMSKTKNKKESVI